MKDQRFVQAIEDLKRNWVIEKACDDRTIRAAHVLRHQVYCVERDFLPGQNGVECDEFDARSTHLVIRDRNSSEIVGTVRLILGSGAEGSVNFPLEYISDLTSQFQLPLTTTAEISRFAISKQRRNSSGALLRLGLMQGIVELSAELGLTHWCAVMEPCLLRLLSATGIHFCAAGPLIEYHGSRQPCLSRIDTLLARVGVECPSVWHLLTDSGRLYSPTEKLLKAA